MIRHATISNITRIISDDIPGFALFRHLSDSHKMLYIIVRCVASLFMVNSFGD